MHRTTILLESTLFNSIKKKAVREGVTLTALIQDFLREGLNRDIKKVPAKMATIPSFAMGKPLVDINDRKRLWDLMDES